MKAFGMQVSMSKASDCYNAPAGRIFAALNWWRKRELGDRFESEAHARRELLAYIAVFYNHQRIHAAQGMKSPAQFERLQ
jgi:transposase InsO family protein